jgi:protein-tyrosine kinase
MNIVEPVDGERVLKDATWDDALISRFGFSSSDIHRITETMSEMQIGFGEAALHLGLLTHQDYDELSGQARARLRGDGDPHVFETAMRQAQSARTLPIKHGMAHPGPTLSLACDPGNPRGEKIRALCTELMLLNGSELRGNVFALVSPGRGEGRSQLAAELAIAFSQLGRRTLLVDADMRNPSQHQLFGAANESGLSRALNMGDSPNLYGIEGYPQLALLNAGVAPANALELVSNRRFERLVNESRRHYDFIVIDTPPIGQYADALQIAAVAQRVLVVSRAERTTFKSMKDMLRRLAVTESKILGAVINRF